MISKRLLTALFAFVLSIRAETPEIPDTGIDPPSVGLETDPSASPRNLYTAYGVPYLVDFTAPRSPDQRIEWRQNGRLLPEQTGSSLYLSKVSYGSQGVYQPWLVSDTARIPGQKFILFVNPQSTLTNVSIRVGLSSSQPHPIVGFVIREDRHHGQTFIRCIGPGLMNFSVPNPGAPKELILRDSNGTEIKRIPKITPYSQLTALRIPDATCGSFPVQVGDAAEYRNLKGGAYTVEVVPEPDSEGIVLLEVYHY